MWWSIVRVGYACIYLSFFAVKGGRGFPVEGSRGVGLKSLLTRCGGKRNVRTRAADNDCRMRFFEVLPVTRFKGHLSDAKFGPSNLPDNFFAERGLLSKFDIGESLLRRVT